jgi:hypothetical protein
MKIPLELHSDDPSIKRLHFKQYRSASERRAQQFLPSPGEAQTQAIDTPWGETLYAKVGDYIVHESDEPEYVWPVDKEIFEESYQEIKPGTYIKSARIELAELTELTGNDPDRLVTIHTLEGSETVRAGDFYLARGIQGEIWPYPRDKADQALIEID